MGIVSVELTSLSFLAEGLDVSSWQAKLWVQGCRVVTLQGLDLWCCFPNSKLI